MSKKVIRYINFLDKEVADAMVERGFNYITQKYNRNEVMYTFELNSPFIASFKERFGKEERESIVYVITHRLYFGGQIDE